MRNGSFKLRKTVAVVGVLGMLFVMQPSLSESGGAVSSDVSREETAQQLGQRLSRSVPRRGYMSDVRAELEQCTLTIVVEYARPCDEALEGEFIVGDTTTVDLKELSGNSEDIIVSPYSAENLRRYHWNLESDVKERTLDANSEFLSEVRRLMEAGIYGAERAEYLEGFSERLMDDYMIESHTSSQSCLQQPVMEPLVAGEFVFELSRRNGDQVVEDLLSYRNEYCSN